MQDWQCEYKSSDFLLLVKVLNLVARDCPKILNLQQVEDWKWERIKKSKEKIQGNKTK